MLKEDLLFYVRQKVPGSADPAGREHPGLSGARPDPEEQPRTDQGGGPRDHHHGFRASTAVIVAQALANQKLVLDQITALNTTTGNLIESTAAMLKKQTRRDPEQASSATVD